MKGRPIIVYVIEGNGQGLDFQTLFYYVVTR